MYEQIKTQLRSGKALVQQKHQSIIKQNNSPNFVKDFNPVETAYYHELNPYFTFNISEDRYFRFAKTFTVRDGLVNFGAFILKYADLIPNFETHFIIHPDLAPMVPAHLKSFFSIWELSQKNEMNICEAKKILIFGIVNDNYIGQLESLKRKLQLLNQISPKTLIEVCLPIRKNPFDLQYRESNLCYEVLNIIKDATQGRQIKIIDTTTMLQKNNFRDSYLIDLAPDKFFISDNFVHYLFASHGGKVEAMPNMPLQEAYLEIALSPYHCISVAPFPDVASRYSEILRYKEHATSNDPVTDPLFQTLFRGNHCLY